MVFHWVLSVTKAFRGLGAMFIESVRVVRIRHKDTC